MSDDIRTDFYFFMDCENRSETYSRPLQIFTMELYTGIASNINPLTANVPII